jgi:N-acetylneuraminate lyase
MTKNFAGEYAALLTPFDQKENIDFKSLQSLVVNAIDQDLTGVYVGGSTGEAFLQSQAERRDCLESVAESSLGKLNLIAHVGSIRTKDCCELANAAKGAGYHAVSAVTPFYYGFSFDALLDHYRAIVDAADGLPMIVYNIPVLTGVALSDMQIEELLNLENVIGIKQTSIDLYQLEKIANRNPGKIIFNGFDEIFLPGQMAGAQGGIGSTYNVIGSKYKEIQKLICSGDVGRAKSVQKSANRLIDLLVLVGVIPGLKYILQQKGIIATDTVRAPFRMLDSMQKRLVDDFISSAL